ncbi:MAG TPA: hypothetical protein VF816_00780 [Rhodocyclaceae bacterium]
MKTRFLIGGLAAALFAAASFAQAGPAPLAADCSKARDPQRCEALQKAKEACKDKPQADKRKCMIESMPPMDCSKARNPQRCEAMEQARAACKDKNGTEFRQCMREHRPKRGTKAAS